jgi:hypothetical protein
MYLALGDYLATRVDAVGPDRLTPIERTLWLVREFHWAVREGGLLGYIVLRSGHAARETQLALSTLGAAHTARVLGDAISAQDSHASGFYEQPGLLAEVEDLPGLVCDHALANREALLSANARQ